MDPLTGKRIVILGLARQGKALAQFAAAVGAQVVVSDMRPAEKLAGILSELSNLEIEYVLGDHPLSLLDGTDVLAISGGVSLEMPLIQSAIQRGIELTNDSQEFMRRCQAESIGITGSAGKTTTTALTGVMSQMAGKRTWVGGNIGRPLIADLDKMGPDDVVVQELSSFQLEIWHQSPHIAAVLNITPNHLDRHKTMTAYMEAKANILRFQSQDDVAVLSADDPGSRALASRVQGKLRLFSTRVPVKEGAFVYDNHIWLRNGKDQQVCHVNDIRLRGAHNVANVLAATLLADAAGIPLEAIRKAIMTFGGVDHRLEQVATVHGVQYINDSIATAPERVLAALNSFNEPLILLAGGRDKDMVWDEWTRQVVARCKAVVLFGALAEMLEEKLVVSREPLAVSPEMPAASRQPLAAKVVRVETLAQAVGAAAALAVPGDVVLLSPGGTSYDAFTDFEERGKVFRELVKGLETERLRD